MKNVRSPRGGGFFFTHTVYIVHMYIYYLLPLKTSAHCHYSLRKRQHYYQLPEVEYTAYKTLLARDIAHNASARFICYSPFVRPSVTRMDQSKTVEPQRIIVLIIYSVVELKIVKFSS